MGKGKKQRAKEKSKGKVRKAWGKGEKQGARENARGNGEKQGAREKSERQENTQAITSKFNGYDKQKQRKNNKTGQAGKHVALCRCSLLTRFYVAVCIVHNQF